MARKKQRHSHFYSARLRFKGARHAQHCREHQVVEHGQLFQEAGTVLPRVPRVEDERCLVVIDDWGGGDGSWFIIIVTRGMRKKKSDTSFFSKDLDRGYIYQNQVPPCPRI